MVLMKRIIIVVFLALLLLLATYYSLTKNHVNMARDIQDEVDLSEIQTALDIYKEENGFYPNTLEALVPEYLGIYPYPIGGGEFLYVVVESSYSLKINREE